MIINSVRTLLIPLKSSEIGPDIRQRIWDKVKVYEGIHLREDPSVFTRIDSITSITNLRIDSDTGICLFQVSVVGEYYTLKPGEQVSLPIASQNKTGWVFSYGPFELFLPEESPSLIYLLPPGTQDPVSLEIMSIRYSDISHRYIVVTKLSPSKPVEEI